jgi:hypothetical protein
LSFDLEMERSVSSRFTKEMTSFLADSG